MLTIPSVNVTINPAIAFGSFPRRTFMKAGMGAVAIEMLRPFDSIVPSVKAKAPVPTHLMPKKEGVPLTEMKNIKGESLDPFQIEILRNLDTIVKGEYKKDVTVAEKDGCRYAHTGKLGGEAPGYIAPADTIFYTNYKNVPLLSREGKSLDPSVIFFDRDGDVEHIFIDPKTEHYLAVSIYATKGETPVIPILRDLEAPNKVVDLRKKDLQVPKDSPLYETLQSFLKRRDGK